MMSIILTCVLLFYNVENSAGCHTELSALSLCIVFYDDILGVAYGTCDSMASHRDLMGSTLSII